MIFRILVVAAGYEPKFVAKVDPARGADSDVKLKVSDAAKAGPERSLHGRVVDAAGNPVEGAVVNSHGIHRADGGGLYGSLPGVDPLAVTDEKGEFCLRRATRSRGHGCKGRGAGAGEQDFQWVNQRAANGMIWRWERERP